MIFSQEEMYRDFTRLFTIKAKKGICREKTGYTLSVLFFFHNKSKEMSVKRETMEAKLQSMPAKLNLQLLLIK